MKKQKLQYLFLIFSPILIGLGVLKLIYYYRAFNIEIVDYLEFTEILTSFLDDIFYIILFIVFGIILEIFQTTKQEQISVDLQHEIINATPSFWKRMKGYYKLYKLGIWLILTLGLNTLAFYLLTHEVVVEMLRTFIVTFSYLLIAIIWKEIKIKIERIIEEELNPMIGSIVVLGSIFLVTFISFIQKDIDKVKSHKKYIKTEIEYKKSNEIIKHVSDSLSYYIGKTNNFVFIYNEENE
jgi:hypothetical protein